MLNLQYTLVLFLVLVPWINCQPIYLPSNQHQTRSYLSGNNYKVVYKNDVIQDFEYVPTVQGYRFNYVLNDGSSREENVLLRGSPNSPESRLDAKNTDLIAIGVGGRPRMPLKNRKLSPKSLQSLAG